MDELVKLRLVGGHLVMMGEAEFISIRDGLRKSYPPRASAILSTLRQRMLELEEEFDAEQDKLPCPRAQEIISELKGLRMAITIQGG